MPKKPMLWMLMLVAIIGLAACSVVAPLTNTVELKGSSMAPTIKDGDRVSVDKNAYNSAGPQRGDIVMYDYQGGKRVSRVIGLPLEAITIKDGAVYVNGNKLDEPYLAAGTRTESATTEFQVPANSYFLLSDNRGQASDSRSIGVIARDKILAKVLR